MALTDLLPLLISWPHPLPLLSSPPLPLSSAFCPCSTVASEAPDGMEWALVPSLCQLRWGVLWGVSIAAGM